MLVGRDDGDVVPLKRGYIAPRSMRAFIADCHRTHLARAVSAALGDLAVGWVAVVVAAVVAVNAPPVIGVPALVVACVVVGRQLRALECLVHEGSHYNWSRDARSTNDLLVRVLAGIPTGASIVAYRESHLRHHGRFGTPEDPDWSRYQELGIESMDRDRACAFALGLLGRLVTYQLSWFRTVRSDPRQLAGPFLWPVLLVAPPALVLAGPLTATAATACWIAGFVVALPLIRFVGEASEHSFSDADTVFDATITNTGRWQRLMVHPHNDGYHTVHHMWPGVPYYRLRRLHLRLLAEDPGCYAARVRFRKRILEAPRCEADSVQN